VVVKGRERRFNKWHGYATGRGRVSTSAHLGVQTAASGLNRGRLEQEVRAMHN
jgi:hypothetical protein